MNDNTNNQDPQQPVGDVVNPQGDVTDSTGMPNLNDMPPAAPVGQDQPMGDVGTPSAPVADVPSAPVVEEPMNPNPTMPPASPMGEVPPVAEVPGAGDQVQDSN